LRNANLWWCISQVRLRDQE
jgi:hypothetical protein